MYSYTQTAQQDMPAGMAKHSEASRMHPGVHTATGRDSSTASLWRSLLCLIALFLLGTSHAHAETVLRVGIYENPPKIFHDDRGEPSGFFVDILNTIAQREQWQLNYIPCQWDRCIQMLQQGELDLMPDVAYSTQRGGMLGFHHEVVLSNWSLLYTHEPQRFKSILDLEAARIAVISGSIQHQVLRRRAAEFDVKPKFIELQSSEATLEAVADGSAEAALVNRLYGLTAADDYHLKPTHILVEASQLYYATALPRNEPLLAAIDRHLTQLKADHNSPYYRALERWVAPLEAEQTPLWLIVALELMLLFTVLLIIAVVTLKYLVKRRTQDLHDKNHALSQSEAMFHALFENSRDAMILSSKEALYDCNPATLAMFRYSNVDAVRALNLDDLSPPYQDEGVLSRELTERKLNEALEQGYSHFEWVYRRADGTTFPAEVTLVPMEVDNRQLIQSTIRDISLRKANEISLQQLNRALQTLSRVNHTLIHSRDESSLLSDICRTIVESGGYLFAWVGFAQHDEARSVKPVAQYGFDEGYLEGIRVSWENNEYGQGPTGIAIRNRKPSVIRDIHSDPRYEPWRENALQHGFASSIALPLIADGTPFGALNIYSRDANAFSEKEVLLLRELADDLAFGIHTQRMKLDHTDLEEERKGHKLRLQDALLQTIQAITVMVEKRDPFTAGHQRRVADLAVRIAKEMQLDAVRIEGIHFGAMIHDIGNIYVPAEILSRPGKLSESEMRIVKSHPSVGYDIVKDIDFPWPVAEMILYHQERLDGSGYPEGLKGNAIPIEARIIAAADVVEAMLSHRPYRSAFRVDQALQELQDNSGIKYDPQVVNACLELFRHKGYTFPV